MRNLLLSILILIFVDIQAQNTISGIVLSDKDHLPLESASVYISGTTKGTYTDSKGNFTLPDVVTPCHLVVSHLAYNLQIKELDKAGSEKLILYLTEKANRLSGVSVKGKGLRERNIKEFRETFLGNDRWGKYAVIKNDSVLVFSRQTDTIFLKATTGDFEMQHKFKSIGTDMEWSKDSSMIYMKGNAFSVETKSPLLIEIPFLGYDVYVDLVSFKLNSFKEWADCDYWAYYRFVVNTKATERQQAKFEKNRRDVYYNSARHFCRALYEDKLKENGYMIKFENKKDTSALHKSKYIDINPYTSQLKSNEVQLTGLLNQKITIFYFCTYDRKPINVNQNKLNNRSKKNVWNFWDVQNNSYIILKSDTCTIRSNGTIPDNNILFGGMMASKRGGTLLPYDYIPKEK
jgi:hypothetical protein